MNKYRHYLILLFPLIFAILASHQLWQSGYFTMQDDIHIFRLQQFNQCLSDLQIPCRLIPDGGLGYSYPLFNFYSPLPYAFAEIWHLMGISLINSLKVSFIFPFFIGSISMFLLSSSFFGPVGGVISSVLYTFAPYHAIDAFVRGALAEHWALALLPLILYSLQSKKSSLFILSLASLLLSHNLTTVYFLPVLLIFSILNHRSKFLIYNSGFSFLISSFFLLPAFFEKNLTTVNTMTQGYFNYINHFVTLNQLFISRFWGYGASLWGPIDDLSFQVGIVHWLIPLIVLFLAVRSKQRQLIYSLFFIAIFSLFLTHNRSTPIWQALPFMAFFQFPWRFLGLAMLCFSLLSGAITKNKLVAFLIIFLAITLNFSYFRADIWLPHTTDSDMLSPAKIYQQSGAGLKDYWPTGTAEYPTVMASTIPLPPQLSEFKKTSNSATGIATVTDQSTSVTLPITYFPDWQLVINGQPASYTIDPRYGQLVLRLNHGTNVFQLSFVNTPIRTLANLLSLLGVSLYIIKLYREHQT